MKRLFILLVICLMLVCILSACKEPISNDEANIPYLKFYNTSTGEIYLEWYEGEIYLYEYNYGFEAYNYSSDGSFKYYGTYKTKNLGIERNNKISYTDERN